MLLTYVKVVIPSAITGDNELSKFGDTTGDASLEDLFPPLDRSPGDQGAEASTSYSDQRNMCLYDGGKNDLARELKARMVTHMESESGQRNGKMFLEMVMDAINEKVIDSSVCMFGQ